jgi:uncharacterized membrane protein/protein-disulfide isomerase
VFARLSLLFASPGLFIASYLTATYYSGVLIPCGPQGGCSDVLYDTSYRFFGLPFAVYGALFYTALVVSILSWFRKPDHTPRVISRALALAGTVVSGLLVGHLIESKIACAWCFGSAASIGLSFICLLMAGKEPTMKKGEFMAVLLVPIAALGAGLVAGNKERDVDELDPRRLAQFARSVFNVNSPRVGRPGRKVILFGEIACPSCRIALNRLLPYAERGEILLVIRHLPIGSHPISRDACALAQIAYERGKLPELIRASQQRRISTEEDLVVFAKELGLPDPIAEAEQEIQWDEKQAENLGVTGAPTLILVDEDKLPQHLSLSEIEARLNQ